MTLMKWNPASLERTFAGDPFFDRFFNLFEDGAWERPESNWIPAMDLTEDADRLFVRMDLPGIDPKAVEVKLTGDRLTVRGERRSEHQEGTTVLKRESVHGTFSRTVRLPVPIDTDKVSATWSNGVMEIELPKAEQFSSREIPVQVK